MKITRKKFLVAAGGTGLAGACGFGWMRGVEASWLDVHRVTVKLRGLPERWRARVLHLSDFHLSSCVTTGQIADAVTLGLAQQPDLVCLTGDFVTGRKDDPTPLAEILRPLSQGRPVFACLGNHDGGKRWATDGNLFENDRILRVLARAGARCLINERMEWKHQGATLAIAGLGDIWQRETQPGLCLPLKGAPTSPTLLLLHNPDGKEFCFPYAWDLMLCGHTHGGQLRLPLIGTPFAPVRDKGFVEGLNPYDGRWIYTTRGVGNLHGLRFNCRPWVSVIELTGET